MSLPSCSLLSSSCPASTGAGSSPPQPGTWFVDVARRCGWHVPAHRPCRCSFLSSASLSKVPEPFWPVGPSARLNSSARLSLPFFKAVTGRVHPAHSVGADISHVFRFGWMRGGVFWGWPSSHTTIAFAMAVTVFTLCPKQRWLGWMAILNAFYVGLGVSMTIHWFSDFAAGAIIGSVIGAVVGKDFGENIEH